MATATEPAAATPTATPVASVAPAGPPQFQLTGRVHDGNAVVLRLSPLFPWQARAAASRDMARQKVRDMLAAIRDQFATSPAGQELANLRHQHMTTTGAARGAGAETYGHSQNRAAALVAGQYADEHEAKIADTKATADNLRARANDLAGMLADAETAARVALADRLAAGLEQFISDKASASQAADRALAETLSPLVNAAFAGQLSLEEANNVRDSLSEFATV
jgi:hypothetical protein